MEEKELLKKIHSRLEQLNENIENCINYVLGINQERAVLAYLIRLYGEKYKEKD